MWRRTDQARVVSAFLGAKGLFHYGRYALIEALRRAGVGPGHKVLLPTVHCRSMLDPVLYLGAEPLLYRVRADLTPDMEALAGLAASARVMVLTHYFGFPNALDAVTAFCRRHEIVLIEDCSHAFYGEHAGRPLGTFGSYAAASVYKFLPTAYGGLLLDNAGGGPVSLKHPGWRFELRTARSVLQGAWQHLRRPRRLDECDASRCVTRARDTSMSSARRPPESTSTVQERWVGTGDTLVGKGVLATVQHGRIVARRRRYYEWWLKALQGVGGARALFPTLPDGVVPYAFPLVLDQPEPAFSALRHAGIPMWRWEDGALCDCPVATRYRTNLVQLPLHQELDEEEVRWMTRTAAAILTACVA